MLAMVAPAFSALPEVEARVDMNQLTLGESFRFFLLLRYEPGQRVDVPALQDILKDFVVGDIKRPEPAALADTVKQVIEYKLQSFQMGEQQIPSLEIAFIDIDGGRLTRSTESIDLEIVSVLQQGEDGPRDIKPPIEIYGGIPLWLAGILAALAVGGIMALIFWLLNRRQDSEIIAATPPPPTDYEAEFRRIAALGLADKGQFKEHYSQLTELLRRFVEEYLQVEALELTTNELYQALMHADLPKDLVDAVEAFLNEADLVKFAKFKPALENAHLAPTRGVELVRSSKEYLKEQRQRALQLSAEENTP